MKMNIVRGCATTFDLREFWTIVMSVLLAICLFVPSASAANGEQEKIKKIVDASIVPLMKKIRIPGMAVGISSKGKRYVFNYGVVSLATGKPVTDGSLFEIGSVSKTMTGTLASYAQVNGKLSLFDKTSKYLPELRETNFGNLTLLNLATHTSGGLPLQLPPSVTNSDQLMEYLKHWKHKSEPGTVRNYANPGIGMLGFITAKCMKQSFGELMETTLFSALGMSHSYINVPATERKNYAQGYTENDSPIRMTTGVLSSEAYGVKTTATDMIRFIDANMSLTSIDEKLQRAILDTHTGYFKTRAMTQDVIWEQYAVPVQQNVLLDGNSKSMIFEPTAVTPITPPEKPRTDVWINKTGSTAGFGIYVAFIPKDQIGIVLLANKTYPIPERLLAAQNIMKRLSD
jgi:beta-lactamase class C